MLTAELLEAVRIRCENQTDDELMLTYRVSLERVLKALDGHEAHDMVLASQAILAEWVRRIDIQWHATGRGVI